MRTRTRARQNSVSNEMPLNPEQPKEEWLSCSKKGLSHDLQLHSDDIVSYEDGCSKTFNGVPATWH